MFESFLVSSWDISHSQLAIQNQIIVSCGYGDTANFKPWLIIRSKKYYQDHLLNEHACNKVSIYLILLDMKLASTNLSLQDLKK